MGAVAGREVRFTFSSRASPPIAPTSPRSSIRCCRARAGTAGQAAQRGEAGTAEAADREGAGRRAPTRMGTRIRSPAEAAAALAATDTTGGEEETVPRDRRARWWSSSTRRRRVDEVRLRCRRGRRFCKNTTRSGTRGQRDAAFFAQSAEGRVAVAPRRRTITRHARFPSRDPSLRPPRLRRSSRLQPGRERRRRQRRIEQRRRRIREQLRGPDGEREQRRLVGRLRQQQR
jgi:hypothetical protein